MKYLYAIISGMLISTIGLFAPVLVLLALPFIRWDKQVSVDRTGHETIRGDLPKWLSWLGTPDERLPGGLYVPYHKEVLNRYGKWLASWYWLGIRNRLHGFARYLGRPATEYIPDVRGYYENGDIWQYSIQVGVFRFLVGYKVYKLLDNSFLASPSFTLMIRR